MKTLKQIEELLAELDTHTADDLESQDLDFKEWNSNSTADAITKVVNMAICMANGGGGTIVFGVADKIKGRSRAILGVPIEIDVNRLKKAIYERTDPKLTPVFEELRVKEGSSRLLVMQVYPGMPPYTDTAGNGTIRIGKDCQPLTGSMRKKIAVETGETDYTASLVEGPFSTLISSSAMEMLRTQAKKEQAPADLLRLTDLELLQALALIKEGSLTRAGLLIAGNEQAIRMEHLDYIERGGSGKGVYWSLSPHLHKQLDHKTTHEKSRRIDWNAAKTRILSVLIEHSKRNHPGLSNQDIRKITHFGRFQAIRLMKELMHENDQISPPGRGRSARYKIKSPSDEM